MKKCDFGGWATINDELCTDGTIIKDEAFREMDGQVVPLVYQHNHTDVTNVLGHAELEYRPGEGMYTYGYFNNTPAGEAAKEQVAHGDLSSLSIYANHLTRKGADIVHGVIREVSLVLAGASPSAVIDYTALGHAANIEDCESEAIIYVGSDNCEFDTSIQHSEEKGEIKMGDPTQDIEYLRSQLDEEGIEILDKLLASAVAYGASMNQDEESVQHADIYGEGDYFDGYTEDEMLDYLDNADDYTREVINLLISDALEDSVSHADTDTYEEVDYFLDSLDDDELEMIAEIVETAIEEAGNNYEE